MESVEYFFFRLIETWARSLSSKNLYRAARLIKFVVYNLAGYRKSVVRANLAKSFPEKSLHEINSISSLYYKNLCELILETFATYSWSEEKLNRHFTFLNPEILNSLKQGQRKMIGVSGHVGNFEMGAVALPSQLKITTYGIYRPLANKKINDYILKKRQRTGLVFIDSRQLMQSLQQLEAPSMVFLLCDQNPTKIDKAYWVNFLNQDTPFVHGPANLAKELNAPIVYFDTRRIHEGHYETALSILIENPADHTQEQITQIIAARLEKTIQRKPDDWLWSHKRWKWWRKDGVPVRF